MQLQGMQWTVVHYELRPIGRTGGRQRKCFICEYRPRWIEEYIDLMIIVELGTL